MSRTHEIPGAGQKHAGFEYAELLIAARMRARPARRAVVGIADLPFSRSITPRRMAHLLTQADAIDG
jgi:hypothetical protein